MLQPTRAASGAELQVPPCAQAQQAPSQAQYAAGSNGYHAFSAQAQAPAPAVSAPPPVWA